MIVTIIPRGQSIVGILPKNKPINGKMTLDLNPREINYCMDKADVYNEDGELLTAKIIEEYNGASNTLVGKSKYPPYFHQSLIQELEIVETCKSKLSHNLSSPLTNILDPIVVEDGFCISIVKPICPDDSANRKIIYIDYDPVKSCTSGEPLYGVITSKNKNIHFQNVNIGTFESGRKFGSKFADFIGEENMAWAIEIVHNRIPTNEEVVELTVQIKHKETNKVIISSKINI